VTELQATTIGSAIASSTRRSHVPVTALKRVLQSHAVLRAMNSGCVWFVPMLEVITARKAAELHGSTWMKRLSSTVTAGVPVLMSPSNEALDADGADEDRSFSSVVRRAQHPLLPCAFADTASVPRPGLVSAPRAARRRRCLWMTVTARSSLRPSRSVTRTLPNRQLRSDAARVCIPRLVCKALRRYISFARRKCAPYIHARCLILQTHAGFHSRSRCRCCERHRPSPSTGNAKHAPAPIGCLARCYKRVEGAAGSVGARRDAACRDGVGFAGVASFRDRAATAAR
jgi:hypothetical protein